MAPKALFTCLILSSLIQQLAAYVSQPLRRDSTCRKTTVAILGAGVAGITAAQTLTNASITDFVIVEYNGQVGGRAYHSNFGEQADGSPYVIELGANWVQGLGAELDGGPENPIWALAQKYNVSNTYSNYSSILTYNETGFVDYSNILSNFEAINQVSDDNAGTLLRDNIQDQTARTGLAVAGWNPARNDMAAQAVEWWQWDFNSATSPEKSSFIFGVTGENLTFNQFGDANNLVVDPRGFNTIVRGEASTFLQPQDERLLLNTIVTSIEYSDDGVTIHNSDGTCISAAHALCTFSLGVLQKNAVNFEPALPNWKTTAIQSFQMTTYTKIFLQFNETFWPEDTQFFLYASPTTRGYYPLFQSLSTPGFLPGSNIIFVTVVDNESYRVENQPEEQTMKEIVEVLQQMFPNVQVPEPIAFMFPRWTETPWSYGSYSNWPASCSLEMHQNLRANVGRLWFAGEATSAQYFGFLQGAWFTGQEMGQRIAGVLSKACTGSAGSCGELVHYDVLHGTTSIDEYSALNGWPVSSFIDNPT